MQLDNLKRIFNERFFRVPDYQRGYSWGDQQLRDLWRDIRILDANRGHYAGVLSVKEAKEAGEIHVVDGQQRLATLVILIQTICECAQLSNVKWFNRMEKMDIVKKYLHVQRGAHGEVTQSVFGYEKDTPSDVFFRTKILGLEDTDGSVPEQTLYTHNLLHAKVFFADQIRGMNVEQLEELFKKITENLKFNYYQLDDEFNEFIAFEVMNNRGKRLSDLELLKNRLIYLSTLLKNDDEEKESLRNDINNVWKTVYEFLGKSPKNALDDDEFLRAHWIMCFQYGRSESKVYRDFLLNEKFTAENVFAGELSFGDIRDYVLDMQNVVKHYYYMHDPSDTCCRYSDGVKSWLSKLNRLGFSSFKPLVASILAKQTDQTKVLEVLRMAEQFVFVASHVHFHRSNKGDNRIYRRTNKVHQDPSALKAEDFHLNSLGVSGVRGKEKFYADVMGGDGAFYGWRGQTYFLYEYELHLQERANGEQKVHWEKVNRETIEHIYPQTPAPGCWKAFSPAKAKKSVHALGNLLLLSRKVNSKLQNKSFEEKKEHFASGSYSAIEVAKNDDWTPEAVAERTEMLLDFLWRRWNIKDE